MVVLASLGRVHLQHDLPNMTRHSGRLWPTAPSIRSYEPGETQVTAVAKNMADRDELLADVCYRLEQAPVVYKHYQLEQAPAVYKHHREV